MTNFIGSFLDVTICVFRQDLNGALWGRWGKEFARWQPSGKNTVWGKGEETAASIVTSEE